MDNQYYLAMSKLVTFEQAKKLKELGYDKDVVRYYKDDGKCSAPSTSEALEWFREVKGIHCSVMLGSYFDGSVRYTGQYLIDVYTDYIEKQTQLYYDTCSEAESALLDALIEYVK